MASHQIHTTRRTVLALLVALLAISVSPAPAAAAPPDPSSPGFATYVMRKLDDLAVTDTRLKDSTNALHAVDEQRVRVGG